MTWVKLDDSFAESEKVIDLSDKAFRCHVEALCYAGRNLTDGRVPKAIVRRYGAKVVRELTDAELWDEGPTIHDYLDYNPSRESVENDRRTARERMRGVRANIARTSDYPVPVPQPEPQDQELEALSDPPARTPSYTAEFENFWANYPLHEGKRAAATAYKSARKRASAEEINAGVERYRAVLAANPSRPPKQAQGWLNADRWLDEAAPTEMDRAAALLSERMAERRRETA